MRHLNTPALISQARKAGLHTSELYPSLTQCPPEPESFEREGRAIDANGFVAEYSSEGHPIHHPPPDPYASR